MSSKIAIASSACNGANGSPAMPTPKKKAAIATASSCVMA